MEQTVKIIIDHREQNQIFEKLCALGAAVEIKQLPVADFILSERVGVERKTTSDFLTSLMDGRLFEQAANMIASFEKPIIILEGEENIYAEREIHPNAIRGAMAALAVDLRIPILRTSSPEETALFIHQIASREQIDMKRSVSLRGEKKPFDDKSMQEYLVCSLPGVGSGIAKNLLKHFKSVKNIINAEEHELRNVEKIGKLKAKKIREIIEKEYPPEH